MVMKKLLATAALVTLIAAPALAQQPRHKSAERAQAAQATQTIQYGRAEARSHSANRANDVYSVGGRYIGSDPDARIRSELLRDEGPTD